LLATRLQIARGFNGENVTNPTNNAYEDTEQISSSELNPLQNPTLGRNLGRWAQVYFTSPPEKREQAVVELLKELETGVVAVPQVSSRKNLEEDNACPRCQRQGQPGQRFCVICGSALNSVSESAKDDRPLAASTAVPSLSPISPEGDAQWLRDRAFASFDADVPKRQAWKYLFALGVVALAGLGYFAWSARSDGATVKKPPIAVSVPPTAEENQRAQAATPDSQPSLPPANHIESRTNLPRTPQATTLAVQRQRLYSDPPQSTSDPAGNGVRELLLAKHFLDGNGGMRDTPEGVKWLWKAVGKQNTSAVILLADLYLLGDGVPKNCDQARLLLVAAAKKGATDAANKLRSLESNGCP
jgi:TPR repeat protein